MCLELQNFLWGVPELPNQCLQMAATSADDVCENLVKVASSQTVTTWN